MNKPSSNAKPVAFTLGTWHALARIIEGTQKLTIANNTNPAMKKDDKDALQIARVRLEDRLKEVRAEKAKAKEEAPKIKEFPHPEKFEFTGYVTRAEIKDEPTLMPAVRLDVFEAAKRGAIMSEIAAFLSANGQFNYIGWGQHKRIVAVKGVSDDWAAYYGPHEWSAEKVATDGDKITTEKRLRQVFGLSAEILEKYRF